MNYYCIQTPVLVEHDQGGREEENDIYIDQNAKDVRKYLQFPNYLLLTISSVLKWHYYGIFVIQVPTWTTAFMLDSYKVHDKHNYCMKHVCVIQETCLINNFQVIYMVLCMLC